MTRHYRSKLEQRLGEGVLKGASYEPYYITYTKLPGKYTPDFVLDNKIVLEVKGYFQARDRTKMLRVRGCNPGLDVRFVFQAPRNTLGKKSDTTYAQWAEKHGFKWCDAKDTATLNAWKKEKGGL